MIQHSFPTRRSSDLSDTDSTINLFGTDVRPRGSDHRPGILIRLEQPGYDLLGVLADRLCGRLQPDVRTCQHLAVRVPPTLHPGVPRDLYELVALRSPDPVEIEITDSIDLHAFSPKDIKAVTIAYLTEARRSGFSVVRIIHGKGIGVQREIVRSVLRETEFVKEFKSGDEFSGGAGSTVVSFVD